MWDCNKNWPKYFISLKKGQKFYLFFWKIHIYKGDFTNNFVLKGFYKISTKIGLEGKIPKTYPWISDKRNETIAIETER